MKSSFDGRLIGFLSSLVSEYANAEATSVPSARTARMTHNEVIRLENSSGVKTLEVKSGIVWLTGTPSHNDLILQKGERFETGTDWPYVIQALEPAEISLSTSSHSQA